jgi:hypothetical protein
MTQAWGVVSLPGVKLKKFVLNRDCFVWLCVDFGESGQIGRKLGFRRPSLVFKTLQIVPCDITEFMSKLQLASGSVEKNYWINVSLFLNLEIE